MFFFTLRKQFDMKFPETLQALRFLLIFWFFFPLDGSLLDSTINQFAFDTPRLIVFNFTGSYIAGIMASILDLSARS